MKLVVNGEPREVRGQDGAPPSTVEALLVVLGVPLERVAVEHNGQIVPRTERAQRRIQPDDVFEIVTLVGGG